MPGFPLETMKWEFTLEKLQEVLGAEHYKEWKSIKQRALDTAVQEINEYSNKRVSYEIRKSGRRVTGIVLTIEPEDGMKTLEAEIRANQRLYDEELEGQTSMY